MLFHCPRVYPERTAWGIDADQFFSAAFRSWFSGQRAEYDDQGIRVFTDYDCVSRHDDAAADPRTVRAQSRSRCAQLRFHHRFLLIRQHARQRGGRSVDRPLRTPPHDHGRHGGCRCRGFGVRADCVGRAASGGAGYPRRRRRAVDSGRLHLGRRPGRARRGWAFDGRSRRCGGVRSPYRPRGRGAGGINRRPASGFRRFGRPASGWFLGCGARHRAAATRVAGCSEAAAHAANGKLRAFTPRGTRAPEQRPSRSHARAGAPLHLPPRSVRPSPTAPCAPPTSRYSG